MALFRSRAATLRRVTDSLLIVVILVVLFGVILGRVVPMTGRQTLIIAGGSMQPALPIGAAVVVEPVAPAALAIGDVISLRTGTELKSVFTHRITRIVTRPDGAWLETKGDANADVDPSLTPAGQVIGRVTFSIPNAGYLLALLSIPSGVLLVVFVAGFLLVITWLIESFEVSGPSSIPAAAARRSGLPSARAAVPTGASISGYAEPAAIRRRRVRWDTLVRDHGSMATAPSPTTVRPTDHHRD